MYVDSLGVDMLGEERTKLVGNIRQETGFF